MVKETGKSKWLTGVVAKVQKLALEKRVIFTHKVAQEIEALALGLDFDDVCDVLASLTREDFYERITFHFMRTKMKSRGRKKSVVGKELPQGSCPSCGTMMKEIKGSLSLAVNGEEISVPESPHLKCSRCKEVVLRLDEARKLREKAYDLYREKYGLLSADQIRSLRERLDLTQSELSQLLGLGQNTLSRWESGRNIQGVAMDYLLRLVRDVPGTLDYLKKLAA